MKESRIGTNGSSEDPGVQAGFALVTVLLLLAALYAGATGIFVAGRSELRASLAHVAAIQAFHTAQAGLVTWLAEPAPPAAWTYNIDGAIVQVSAYRLLSVDSVIVLYRIVSRSEVGSGAGERNPSAAARGVSILGSRTLAGPIMPVRGSWRERF